MTTVNMKDFIENGSKVTQGVMEEINKSVKPIIERERTKEDRSADIGELKGVLSAAKAAGLSKVIISVPVRLLAIDTSYQTPNRTERDLRQLVNNWVDYKCQPLMGVPHYEDGWMVIMDGYGRTIASQMVDAQKYIELPVLVSLDAPMEPKTRREFEAEMYVYQNRDVSKMTPIQRHGGLEVLNDPTVKLLDSLKDTYGFSYVKEKGMRESGVLGSYSQVFEFCRIYGKNCMTWIFDICQEAGFDRKGNGYASYILRALKDIWRLYEADRDKTKDYLGHKFRPELPNIIKSHAVSKYPMLSVPMAVSLYVEDLVVNDLNLQQSRTVEGSHVVPVRKFA